MIGAVLVQGAKAPHVVSREQLGADEAAARCSSTSRSTRAAASRPPARRPTPTPPTRSTASPTTASPTCPARCRSPRPTRSPTRRSRLSCALADGAEAALAPTPASSPASTSAPAQITYEAVARDQGRGWTPPEEALATAPLDAPDHLICLRPRPPSPSGPPRPSPARRPPTAPPPPAQLRRRRLGRPGRGRDLETRSPAGGAVLAEVPLSGAEDVAAATAAARAAFPAWRATPPQQRARALWLRDLVASHQEELAELVTLDMGKTSSTATTVAMPRDFSITSPGLTCCRSCPSRRSPTCRAPVDSPPRFSTSRPVDSKSTMPPTRSIAVRSRGLSGLRGWVSASQGVSAA